MMVKEFFEKEKSNGSYKVNRALILLGIIVAIVTIVLGYHYSTRQLTYKEYMAFGKEDDTWETITISTVDDELRQTIVMPYDIMSSIALKIGTYSKDNNSEWQISVVEDNSNKEIYVDNFNASLITDNAYYEIEFDKNIRVKKGEKYTIAIKPNKVNENSQLAFYVDTTSENEGILYHGEERIDGQVAAKIFGGDVDYWWFGFYCLIALIVLILAFRMIFVFRIGDKVTGDTIVQILSIGLIFFILRYSFSISGAFTDEFDNMRGGIVISQGGVLYKDYVVQHTPMVYYLCAVFAALGADSISQFRLAYYFLEAVIWAFIYFRYSQSFGKKKVALIPVLEAICISSIISPQGYQILSDGWQGLMFTVLILEFLQYYKDRTLEWTRCIIVSICVWGSFGAAFVSAYALIFLVIVVLGIEIIEWKGKSVSFKAIIGRYYKLLLSIIVPFLCAVIYFKANGALRRAYDQCYAFNRKVYPKYTGGYGDKLVQPFINGIQNFFNIIANNFNSIITATATNVVILQLVLVAAAVAILIRMMEKKHYCESLTLLLMTVFSATRGYGFHGLAAWYLIVMLVAMNIDLLREMMPRLNKPVIGLASIVLLSTYIVAVGNNFLYEQSSISELEARVIELTEEDDDKGIFVDAYSYDSLYFSYKGRNTINPAVYMLPWYMDWYETDNMTALSEKMPHVIIYNEDRECWGYTHYNNELDKMIEENYTRLGDADSGWRYSVWTRNE